MKRFILTAAVLTMGAAAQDVARVAFQPAAVMGTVIKGAPYSGVETTESLQILGDGTRITHQNTVKVYRDGEGRVRRDGPTQITIFDPVEGVSYALNPGSMTATKGSVKAAAFNFSVATSGNGTTTSSDAALADAKKRAKVMLDEMQTELASSNGAKIVVDGNTTSQDASYNLKMQLDMAAAKLAAAGQKAAPAAESLGQQVMEGVTVEGTRSTMTLEQGAIGNDRPITTVSERWFSPQLQTVVMTKRSDPRSGEETFRLTNVQLGEPGADLFLLPPGYQILLKQTVMPVKTGKEQ